jgi:hypothetical protein
VRGFLMLIQLRLAAVDGGYDFVLLFQANTEAL